MQPSDLDGFEQAIVDQWSEIHKRSAVAYLIMLGLKHRPSWSAELLQFIDDATGGHWGVDERSLYRALRRLEKTELVTHGEVAAAGTGAKRKVFQLTASGLRVLERYTRTTLAYQRRLADGSG